MFSSQKNKRTAGKSAAFLLLIAAFAIAAPAVFAHAKMLRSQPANGEKLPQAPKTIELTFSERLQQTELNSIVVTDQNGTRADKKPVALSEDGRKMVVELEELVSGTFNVEWKALSADDHLMKGKFTFTVAEKKTAEIAATPPPINSQTFDTTRTIPENQIVSENQMPPAQETGTLPFQSLVRWLAYLAMMALCGGFVYLLLVLKPSLRRSANLTDEEKARAFDLGEKRFIGLTRLSLFLIVISAIAGLVLQTSSVLDTGISGAIAPANLFRILTQTGFGIPWFLQIAATLAIFAISFFAGRKPTGDSLNSGLNRGQTVLWAGFILSALLMGTLSLTGHARAAQEDYKFAVFSDWLHLVAAGIWVGGVFHLVLTLPKSVSGLQDLPRLSVLSRVISRFSGLAVACTILLALTGIYNSWIHLGGIRDLYSKPYGIILLVKIVLFLLMLPLGGFNRYFIRPRIEKLAGTADPEGNSAAAADFYFVLYLEAAFGAAVLLLAAMLAFLPHLREHHAAVRKNPTYFSLLKARAGETGRPETAGQIERND